MSVVIVVPVLGRAEAIRPMFESVARTTTIPWHVRFVCSPGDTVTTERVFAIVQSDHRASMRIVPWDPDGGDWAKKINLAYSETSEDFLVLGATDLRFHPNWDVEFLKVAEASGAGVIGTDDMGNGLVMRGGHSTHPIVRRDYADVFGTIDEDGKILHEGYAHQWVDNELVETAMARGEWAFAHRCKIEHLHPFWRKGEMDSTYEKALSTPRPDQRLFAQRRRLWQSEARMLKRIQQAG